MKKKHNINVIIFTVLVILAVIAHTFLDFITFGSLFEAFSNEGNPMLVCGIFLWSAIINVLPVVVLVILLVILMGNKKKESDQ